MKEIRKKENMDICAEFPTAKDPEFGGVHIKSLIEDFNAYGFRYGDSCDIRFSNGFALFDVPYYNGYYERVDKPIIVAYPGDDHLSIAYCSGGSMWERSGSQVGDTVTVSLREKEKYINQQKAMESVYSLSREDFTTDEDFANFRVMTGGKLKKGMFYRGSSPVNDQRRRAVITDRLIEKAGIRFDFDLADDEEKLARYMSREGFASPYFTSLLNSGKVILLGLTAGYRLESFAKSLAAGFKRMMLHEGPYYIHCTEGKDRTGFVCMLIEALAGASFEEIEYDYMKTYDSYYGITREKTPEKYAALSELRLLDMLWWLRDLPDGTDLTGMRFLEGAENYLHFGGLTDREIQKLEDFLTE